MRAHVPAHVVALFSESEHMNLLASNLPSAVSGPHIPLSIVTLIRRESSSVWHLCL